MTVSCHSPAEGFAADLPAYVQVNDSFAFDPVQGYRAPVEPSGAWVLPALVFLAVSAVIFVPLAVIYGGKGKEAIRRRRARPAPPAEEVLDAIPVADDPPPPAASAFAPSTGIVTNLTPTSAPLPPRSAERPRVPAQKTSFFTCYLEATTCSRELTYHVYALPGELYFIEADGRDSGLGDLTADDLFALADGDTSFRAAPEDLVRARLDAVGFWDVLGGDALGKLRMLHATRGELTFDFRNAEQMRRAIEQLPAALGELLVVNAVYDRRNKKFVQAS